MPKDAINIKVREVISDTMSLKPLLYDSSNNHIRLTESIKELVVKVELKRNELASTLKW